MSRVNHNMEHAVKCAFCGCHVVGSCEFRGEVACTAYIEGSYDVEVTCPNCMMTCYVSDDVRVHGSIVEEDTHVPMKNRFVEVKPTTTELSPQQQENPYGLPQFLLNETKKDSSPWFRCFEWGDLLQKHGESLEHRHVIEDEDLTTLMQWSLERSERTFAWVVFAFIVKYGKHKSESDVSFEKLIFDVCKPNRAVRVRVENFGERVKVHVGLLCYEIRRGKTSLSNKYPIVIKCHTDKYEVNNQDYYCALKTQPEMERFAQPLYKHLFEGKPCPDFSIPLMLLIKKYVSVPSRVTPLTEKIGDAYWTLAAWLCAENEHVVSESSEAVRELTEIYHCMSFKKPYSEDHGDAKLDPGTWKLFRGLFLQGADAEKLDALLNMCPKEMQQKLFLLSKLEQVLQALGRPMCRALLSEGERNVQTAMVNPFQHSGVVAPAVKIVILGERFVRVMKAGGDQYEVWFNESRFTVRAVTADEIKPFTLADRKPRGMEYAHWPQSVAASAERTSAKEPKSDAAQSGGHRVECYVEALEYLLDQLHLAMRYKKAFENPNGKKSKHELMCEILVEPVSDSEHIVNEKHKNLLDIVQYARSALFPLTLPSNCWPDLIWDGVTREMLPKKESLTSFKRKCLKKSLEDCGVNFRIKPAPLVTQRAIGFYASPPPSLISWKKTLINLATGIDSNDLKVWRDLLEMKPVQRSRKRKYNTDGVHDLVVALCQKVLDESSAKKELENGGSVCVDEYASTDVVHALQKVLHRVNTDVHVGFPPQCIPRFTEDCKSVALKK